MNLAVRFILELCALAIYAYWGFRVGNGGWGRVVLSIVAPVLVAVLWGLWGSPQAAYPLTGWVHLGFEIVLFGLPVWLLLTLDRPMLAMVYGVLYIINKLLMQLWHQ
ncbi:YrdB family protein [Paenibacillus sp. Z3-2]